MKKLKFIANIFFLLSLTLMLLVILQQLNIIHFLPTTIPPYKPSTHEAINKAVKYTILINSIGYIFLFISITLHIINLIIILKSNLTQNKISPPKKKKYTININKNIVVCLYYYFYFFRSSAFFIYNTTFTNDTFLNFINNILLYSIMKTI